jgi:hypothetical protein
VACAEIFYWVARRGAIVVQRWRAEDGTYPFAVLDSRKRKIKDGQIYKVVRGKIQRSEP